MNEVEKADPPPLRDALDCTICLEAPASPINRCQNGHIVCGICAGKVVQCGLCKTRLQKSILAERLSRQLELKRNCPNSESGCVNPIAAADFKDHVATCYYRDVTCCLNGNNTLEKIAISDYPAHLQKIHKIKFTEISDGEWATGEYHFLMDGDKFADSRQRDINMILKKDKAIFLIHFCNDADQYKFWVSLLADAKEAKKHSIKLKISNHIDVETQIGLSFTVPALAFHDLAKLEDSHCAVIPACAFATPGRGDSFLHRYVSLIFKYTII
ncbi:E3 ubiquitin-protein ligase SINAT5 [Folsomia candida]|uniref:E3 ubiquitin-protein ligase Siah2 n=1 Tax=Folsomia candida TaxID=158441 RepID=A0A226DNT0_FOLCA|nr:E3 ubiquitin-protein ligase SINAT5 [Folsomia candida]OXA47195.1 E3 ubiquitin-protein ligase Siah2 [Folsomia candida]